MLNMQAAWSLTTTNGFVVCACLLPNMNAKNFYGVTSARMTELLQDRFALSRDDLEYVVERTAQLKDERLRTCIAELIGWGDDERAEIETFIAISLELMKISRPSQIQNAARMVYIRQLI